MEKNQSTILFLGNQCAARQWAEKLGFKMGLHIIKDGARLIIANDMNWRGLSRERTQYYIDDSSTLPPAVIREITSRYKPFTQPHNH